MYIALKLIEDQSFGEFSCNIYIDGIYAPVVSNHGKLGPRPRPWHGIGAVHMITDVCLFRARGERPTSMA